MISGANGITKSGAGTVVLSGTNTYTGTTSILAGDLVVGSNATAGVAGALGNASSSVLVGATSGSNNASLLVNGPFTLGRSITVQSGNSGTTSLGGTNTSGIANITSSILLNKSATLTAAPGGTARFATGAISGAGSVSVSGGGTVVLNGTNTFTGSTSVLAGTLAVETNVSSGVPGPLGSSTSSILLGNTSGDSDASFLVGGSFTVGRGITVQAGNTGTATLRSTNTSGTAAFSGGMLLNKNVRLVTELGGTLSFTSSTFGAGGINVDGGGTVRLSGSNSFSGSTSILSGTLVVASGSALGSSSSVNLGDTSGTNDAALLINGAFTMNRSIVTQAGNAGTLTLGGTNSSGTASFTGAITLNKSFNVTTATGGTVSLGSGAISGAGGMTLVGSGTVQLSGVNSYTGVTSVLAGTLSLAGNAPAGANGVLGNASSAVLVGDTTGSNDVTLQLNGAFTVGRDITVRAGSSGTATLVASNASGTANITGNLQLDKSTIFNVSSVGGTVSFSTGGISGSGGITKTGAGSAMLSGVNSYTGSTSVIAGALSVLADAPAGANGALGNSTSAVLLGDASGSNSASLLITGSFMIGRDITVRAGSSGIATLGGNSSGAASFTGNIILNKSASLSSTAGGTVTYMTGAISGAGGVSITGSSLTILAGANSYTGTTTINSGILRASHGVGLPAASGLVFSGGVFESAGVFTRNLGSGAGQVRWTSSGGFSAQGGSLAVQLNGGLGTLTWGSASFVSGSSALQLGSTTADSLTDFQNGIDLAGAVRTINVPNNPSSTTDLGRLSGILSNGGITKTGNGILSLTAPNTYNGVTSVLNGTLSLGADAPSAANGALGNATSPVLVGDSAGSAISLLLTDGPFTIGRDITVQSGSSGSATIGGTNTSGTATFTGNIVLNKNAIFSAAPGGTVRFETGTISGPGGVTIAGGGTVHLAGTNVYVGATSVQNGTLVLDGITAGDITLSSGASFGGHGTISGTVGGSGSVDPGNSPGIITASQTDPAGGLDYNFEFTVANASPNYLSPTNPNNDVFRLTHPTTPFVTSLNTNNAVNVYLEGLSLTLNNGDFFRGGFFTNVDSLSSINGGAFSFYKEDASGSFTYLGKSFVLLNPSQWSVTAQAETADFGGGATSGYVTQFTYTAVAAVPEPGTLTLTAIATLSLAGYRRWRRREKR